MIWAELDQALLPTSQRLSKRLIEDILKKITRSTHSKQKGVISVAFISEKEMQRLNRVYRKKDYVTDVLAFAYGDEILGEVLICYPQAKRQAAERGHTVAEEVRDLLIHGILHVLGYDHIKPNDAQIMLPLQQKIFSSL